MGNKNKYYDIPNYEGYYVININGIIKSVDRGVPDKRLGIRNIKGHVLTHFRNKFGYVFVQLWKNKKSKNIFLHRLLGMIFIKNPENKTDINHKNGIRDDNRIENL